MGPDALSPIVSVPYPVPAPFLFQCSVNVPLGIGVLKCGKYYGSYLRERLFYRFYCNHSMPGSCADSLLAFKAIISFADVQMNSCLGFNLITPKRCRLKRQCSTVGRVVNSSVKFTTAVTSLMRCSLSTFLYFPSESSYWKWQQQNWQFYHNMMIYVHREMFQKAISSPSLKYSVPLNAQR